MKKLLAIVLAAVMAFGVFAFTGCSDKTGKSDFKVGAILIGDSNKSPAGLITCNGLCLDFNFIIVVLIC